MIDKCPKCNEIISDLPWHFGKAERKILKKRAEHMEKFHGKKIPNKLDKKEKKKTKSVLTIGESKKDMLNYIFDEDLVLKNKVFTQLKLDGYISTSPFNNTFAYGLLLPKEIPTYNKKNEVIGKEQVWSPVLITSDGKLIEATKEVELRWKIKFESIPSHLPLRWSLESIKNHLEGGDELMPELNAEELANKVKSQYERFCFFRERTWYKVNALWDIGTYFHELFDSFPIKEERGLQETGKTKSMNVSKNISFNSTGIMINPSEATLFRETHDKRPTKYIDEAEKLFSFKKGGIMESDNRIELINGSYSKGAAIPRIEKVGNKFVCVYYHVYSPTRIGSIKGLFGATESRSITQIHTRNLDSDKRGETEPQDNDPEFQMIRDYLYLFGLKNWKYVEDNYNDNSLYDNLKLKKRDLQLWRPLLAISKLINDNWFDEIVDFAEKLSLQRKEDFITEDSWDFRILKIIKEIIDGGIDIIRPKEIKEKYKIEYVSETEKYPHEKTIIKNMDKIGFKELRQQRDSKGNYYLITKENFYIIVNPICPILSTLPTLPTQSLINNEKGNVGNKKNNVDNVGKGSNGNVGNEGNVGNVGSSRWGVDGVEVQKIE